MFRGASDVDGGSPAFSDGGAGGGGDESFAPQQQHAADYTTASFDEDDQGSPGVSARGGGGGGGGRGSGIDEGSARNFKVVIRVRPPLPRELHGERPFQNTVQVDASETSIVISENLPAYEEAGGAGGAGAMGPFSTHTLTFDHVYDVSCDQRKVFETTAQAVVESSLNGYNATILAVSGGGRADACACQQGRR